jgi:hypothetical protein
MTNGETLALAWKTAKMAYNQRSQKKWQQERLGPI